MIKYDSESLSLMSYFEKLTRSKLRDMFDMGDFLVFVVEENNLRKALGDKGANVKKLKDKLNRKIKIVEFSKDLERFVRNLVQPLKLSGYEFTEGIVVVEGIDTNTKGLLIGRKASNLRAYEAAIQRYFKDVKEMKVV